MRPRRAAHAAHAVAPHRCLRRPWLFGPASASASITCALRRMSPGGFLPGLIGCLCSSTGTHHRRRGSVTHDPIRHAGHLPVVPRQDTSRATGGPADNGAQTAVAHYYPPYAALSADPLSLLLSGTNLLAVNTAPWGSLITVILTQGASKGGASTLPPSAAALVATASASSIANVTVQLAGTFPCPAVIGLMVASLLLHDLPEQQRTVVALVASGVDEGDSTLGAQRPELGQLPRPTVQFFAVAPAKLGPARHVMSEPASQLLAGSDLLEPPVERRPLPTQAARPQTFDQDAPAVRW